MSIEDPDVGREEIIFKNKFGDTVFYQCDRNVLYWQEENMHNKSRPDYFNPIMLRFTDEKFYDQYTYQHYDGMVEII